MEMNTNLVLDIDEIEDDSNAETRTYGIDFVNGRIVGKINGIEAVQQAITKILLTERFKNLIYSSEYGCELKDTLINSDDTTEEFLKSEIPTLIKEALLTDSRILDVENFSFKFANTSHDSVGIAFDVSTVYGEMTVEEVI